MNWIIFVFEFNRIVNPIKFVSSDYLANKFDIDDLELITYYVEVIKYLKYNFKVKYRFSKAYDFSKQIDLLNVFINKRTNNLDVLIFEDNFFLDIANYDNQGIIQKSINNLDYNKEEDFDKKSDISIDYKKKRHQFRYTRKRKKNAEFNNLLNDGGVEELNGFLLEDVNYPQLLN